MKKTYMKPELEQLVIDTTSLMSLSLTDNGNTVTGTVSEDEVKTESTVLSKDNAFDLWDEEE